MEYKLYFLCYRVINRRFYCRCFRERFFSFIQSSRRTFLSEQKPTHCTLFYRNCFDYKASPSNPLSRWISTGWFRRRTTVYEARQWSAALGRLRCAIAAECRAMSINLEPVVTATVFYRINDILLINLKLFRLLWRAGVIVVTTFVAFFWVIV